MQVDVYETACFETSKREWVPCTPGCSCRSLALQVEINMMQWKSPIAKACWRMLVVPPAILKPTLNVYITGHLPLLSHLTRGHHSSITQHQQQPAFDTLLLHPKQSSKPKTINSQPLHTKHQTPKCLESSTRSRTLFTPTRLTSSLREPTVITPTKPQTLPTLALTLIGTDVPSKPPFPH